MLTVQNLSIAVHGHPPLVRQLSFSLQAGETLAVVGESGSGKSLTALAIMGLLAENLGATADALSFAADVFPGFNPGTGQNSMKAQDPGSSPGKTQGKVSNLLQMSPRQHRLLRGQEMGMIFQEPLSALNPVMTIGAQIEEVYRIHTTFNTKQRRAAVQEQLAAVQLPNPQEMAQRYPHQLSGGQRQRVMIAMAMALKPKLLIADEPTTALDATVQAEILRLMKELQAQHNTAILLITHDFGVAKHMAKDVLVMEKGRAVEFGRAEDLLQNPQEAYTKKLLAAEPTLCTATKKAVTGEVILTAENLAKTYNKPTFFSKKTPTHALQQVSLTLKEGQTLGVVGESGSGKSTLAKCVVQLEQADGGRVHFLGEELVGASQKNLRKAWRNVQMVFQDPFASLNPRQTVGASIAEGLKAHGVGTPAERKAAVQELLQDVGLPEDAATRYPHQFSGGQRQRIVLARALALKPKLVIADEAVASLDVSIQKQVLELMQSLKEKYNLSYLFISHDLRVVSHVADEVMVMHKGRVVEAGATHQIFSKPKHPYTRQLLESLP